MAEKEEQTSALAAIVQKAPKTNVMPETERNQKFLRSYQAASTRIQEFVDMGLSVRQKGNSIELQNSEGLKVSAPLAIMDDDSAYNSFKLGFKRQLYESENKMVRREAIITAIADYYARQAEAALARQ